MLLKKKKEKMLLEMELQKAKAIVALCEDEPNENRDPEEAFENADRPEEPALVEQFNALDLRKKPNEIPSTPPATIHSPSLNSAQSAETVVQNIIKEHQQHISAVRLPHITLTKFTGDSIKYNSFMKAFESMVEKNVDDPIQRLQHLIANTTGNVKLMLKSFQHDEPSIGYERAKAFLKDKYGEPFKIRNAYMEQVRKCSMIPTGKNQTAALEEFSSSLRALMYTVDSMPELNTIDNTDFIKELVRTKFPIFMKREWSNYVERIWSTEHRQLM